MKHNPKTLDAAVSIRRGEKKLSSFAPPVRAEIQKVLSKDGVLQQHLESQRTPREFFGSKPHYRFTGD